MKEKLKNKKVIGIGIAVIIAVIAFIGIMLMNKSSLVLKNKEFTVEYGQQVSKEIKDYLNLDKTDPDKKNDILSKAKLNINIENEAKKQYPSVSEYNAGIIFEKEEVNFKIIIKDTTAPTFKDFKEIIETAKDVKPDYTKLYQADDLSQVEITCEDTNVKYETVGEYKANIKALDASKNEISKEITVKVTEPAIKLDKSSINLYVKKTVILKTDIKGKEKKAIFKSSNDKIASVDNNGKVTAKAAGTTNITASANGKDITCKVIVKESPKGSSTTTKKDSNGNNVTVVTYPNSNHSSETSIKNSDYVKVKSYIPNIYVNLKYATSDNFTKQKIYNFTDAYLRYGTVVKLKKVQSELNKKGYSLLIWDAYRPFYAQKKLWEVVNDPRYVADPSKGPRGHNLGKTIDITIVKSNGSKIPMPTEFDDFSKKADRDYSDIKNQDAVKNVKLLQSTMYKHGFTGYKNEWWDYTDTVSYSYIDFQPKQD